MKHPLPLLIHAVPAGVLLLALYESTGPAPPPLQEHEHQLAGAMQAAAYTLEVRTLYPWGAPSGWPAIDLLRTSISTPCCNPLREPHNFC